MSAVNENARPTFLLALRVYYEDTDAAGLVYYANYLRFLERARTEWLRELGFDQSRLSRERAIAFAVRSLNAEYLKPARLDDLLTVASEIESLGGAQLTFDQRIERDRELLFSAKVRVACLDVARMKPTPFPQDVKSRFAQLKAAYR